MAKPFIIPRVEREIQKAITENLYRLVGELNRSMATARGFAVNTVERTTGGRIVRGTNNLGRPTRRSSTSRDDKLRDERRQSSEYKVGRDIDRSTYRESQVAGFDEKGTEERDGREVRATDEQRETMAGYPRRSQKYEEVIKEDEGVDFSEAAVYERVKVVKGFPSPINIVNH